MGTFEISGTPRFASGYVTAARGWTQPLSRLSTGYEVSCAEPYNWSTACGRFRYRGAAHALHGPDLNVAEPGEVTHVEFGGALDFRVLILEPAYVHDVLGDAGSRSHHLRPGAFRDDALHARLLQACAAVADGGVDDLERECAVRDVVLGTFARIGETAPGGAVRVQAAVRRARDYLHDNALERVELDHVARAVSCSKFHLTRAFHRAYGAPIHRYHQLVKVERAIALIRSGAALADAAAAIGFADQAHMTRTFRATLGVTPSTYRPTRRSFAAQPPRR